MFKRILKAIAALLVCACFCSLPGQNIALPVPGSIQIKVPNETGTGTTLNKLAKLTGAPSAAIIAATTDVDGVVGIVVSGAGTSGSARLARDGTAPCVFDGATTAGNYVQISSSTAGDCHDAGSVRPISGQIIGRVLSTNGSGGTYNVTVSGLGIAGVGGIVQNSQSAAYTTVLSDCGKQIYHPGADTTARDWTIDSNTNVPAPIGCAITFVNDTSAGTITIKITSDTLVLAGAGTTGNRTLAANGIATALKVTSTRWIISGTGLT